MKWGHRIEAGAQADFVLETDWMGNFGDSGFKDGENRGIVVKTTGGKRETSHPSNEDQNPLWAAIAMSLGTSV